MSITTTPKVTYIKDREQVWILDSYVSWRVEYMHWDNELKRFYSCPLYNWDQPCPPHDDAESVGRHVFRRYFFRGIDETGEEQVYSVPRMIKQHVETIGDYRVFEFAKRPFEYVVQNHYPAPGPIPRPTLDIEAAIAGMNVDYEAARSLSLIAPEKEIY